MSVSLTAYIKVGIPADRFFKDIKIEVRDQYELRDQRTGEPTGKMSPGEKWVVGTLHNGKTVEVKGDNDFCLKSIFEDYERRIDATYDYYMRDSDRNLACVFVGITLASGSCYETKHQMILQENIDGAKKEFLKIFESLGYNGPVETTLVTQCS